MAWFIIEGCDGTGKSSLVEALKTELARVDGRPTKVLHHSQLKQDPFLEYEVTYDTYQPGASGHIISDRWALGELVYGPLYRGSSKLTEPGRIHIDKYAQAKGACCILMENDADVLRARLDRRGEDYLRTEHIEYVLSEFDTAAVLSVLDWQPMRDPVEADVRWLVDFGLKLEQRATFLPAYPTYVGDAQPEYLLLGEKRNDPRFKSAFVPYPATSGYYLLGSLLDHPHVLETCGLANSLEEPVKILWERLGKPRVVALGKKADSVCREAHMPYVPVPHPQYVRRFHHKRRAEYGWTIERACHGLEVTFP